MKYNFKIEFDNIDFFLDQERYREAGFCCGYMLEYIIRGIYGELRKEAKPAVLREIIKNEEDVGKRENANHKNFELGKLIQLLVERKLIYKIKEILKINCNHSRNIPFNSLVTIRNNCVHPCNPIPKKDEIELFKDSLNTLSLELKSIFKIEMVNINPSINISRDYIKLKKINSDLNKEIIGLKETNEKLESDVVTLKAINAEFKKDITSLKEQKKSFKKKITAYLFLLSVIILTLLFFILMLSFTSTTIEEPPPEKPSTSEKTTEEQSPKKPSTGLDENIAPWKGLGDS